MVDGLRSLANGGDADFLERIRSSDLVLTGPKKADVGGKAHLLAGRLAVEDAQKYTKHPVELLTADFQQNLDVAMTIARNWIEQGVGVIVDAPNSAIAKPFDSRIVRSAHWM